MFACLDWYLQAFGQPTEKEPKQFLSFAFKVGCGCTLVFAELLLSTLHTLCSRASLDHEHIADTNVRLLQCRKTDTLSNSNSKGWVCSMRAWLLQDLEGRLHTLNSSSWKCSVRESLESDVNEHRHSDFRLF